MSERRRQQMRAASRRYYYRRQLRWRGAGLNSRGQQPKRKAWSELGQLRGRERRRERERRVRAARIAAGLNWRGQPRQLKRRPELGSLRGQARHNALCRILRLEARVSPIELAWRQMREEMGNV